MRGFGIRVPLVLCLPLMALFSTAAFSERFEDLQIGEKAPEFTLKDLAEREYTLSDLEDDIVVIQFGSSTTTNFLGQIKPINELIRKYRRKGVTFLTIYTAEQQFEWQADDYFSKYQRAKGLRFQYSVQSGQRMGSKILVDDMEEVVYQAYGSVPAGVFIVDKEGNLSFKAQVVKASDVEKALQKTM